MIVTLVKKTAPPKRALSTAAPLPFRARPVHFSSAWFLGRGSPPAHHPHPLCFVHPSVSLPRPRRLYLVPPPSDPVQGAIQELSGWSLTVPSPPLSPIPASLCLPLEADVVGIAEGHPRSSVHFSLVVPWSPRPNHLSPVPPVCSCLRVDARAHSSCHPYTVQRHLVVRRPLSKPMY